MVCKGSVDGKSQFVIYLKFLGLTKPEMSTYTERGKLITESYFQIACYG